MNLSAKIEELIGFYNILVASGNLDEAVAAQNVILQLKTQIEKAIEAAEESISQDKQAVNTAKNAVVAVQENIEEIAVQVGENAGQVNTDKETVAGDREAVTESALQVSKDRERVESLSESFSEEVSAATEAIGILKTESLEEIGTARSSAEDSILSKHNSAFNAVETVRLAAQSIRDNIDTDYATIRAELDALVIGAAKLEAGYEAEKLQRLLFEYEIQEKIDAIFITASTN